MMPACKIKLKMENKSEMRAADSNKPSLVAIVTEIMNDPTTI